MTRLLVPIVAFAVGLGGALALASCGDDEEGLLPGNTADEILTNLERVEQRAEEQDCSGAAAAADQVAAQIEELGPEVSERLKRALTEGADQLQDVVDTCEEEPVAPPPELDTTEIPTDEPTDTVETDEDDEDDEESEGPPETTDTTTPTTDTVPTTPTTPTAPVPTPDEGDGEPGSGSGGIGPGRVTEGD